MRCLSARICWGLLLLAVVWGAAAQGQEQERLQLEEVMSMQPFLRWERPAYRNYALQNYWAGVRQRHVQGHECVSSGV